MSVTIDGIKGYEYQYKVTLLLFLSTKAEKIRMFVEKEGSEDAFIEIENQGVKNTVEIQVKRENNPIDIPKLASWLSHFQEKKSDNNLLQRLTDDKNNFVLFVSHSRCSDSTVRFKTNLSQFEKHKSISYSNVWIKKFSESLGSQKFSQKKFGKNRELYCHTQAKKIKRKLISDTLDRCLILEEYTDEKVDSQILNFLNSKFNIAHSQSEKLYLELLKIVRNGRDVGLDIHEDILRKIDQSRVGFPRLDPIYKERDEENELTQELFNKGCLLLTGFSQCGKSELAKKIAAHYVKKGYDYQIHDDISSLSRFLSSNIKDEKIAILEDPFGHISLKENYNEIFRNLRKVLTNIENNHLLIVTSRTEILFNHFNSSDILDCKIGNHLWIDLTVTNMEVIMSYWEYIAKFNSLPNEIILEVTRGLEGSRTEDLLQIGQLSYLAHEEIDSINNKKFFELEHIARRDSDEIARTLKSSNKKAGDLLSILAVCSTPTHPVSLNDLAYILSAKTELFSVINKDGFTSVFGRDATPHFPEYPKDLFLQELTKEAISYLEDRKFVQITDKSILISHPNYYEAGRFLFYKDGSFGLNGKLSQFKRCVACLNPITAFHASKNFYFLYPKIDEYQKKELINIAFNGLNSIFPAVEDNSLIFLINIIPEIDGDRVKCMYSKIQGGGTSSTDIYWHGNIPFISDVGSFSNLFVKVDQSIVKMVEDDLNNRRLPNKHDAWIFIEELKGGKTISKESLQLLLQFDEAFIRKKIAFSTFFKPKILNEDLILDIFNDEHPSVVFSAIRSSLINWFNLQPKFQNLIHNLIIKSLKKKQIAIRAYNLISTFSIHYGHEALYNWEELDKPKKKELWKLWGELYPLCMRNIPLGLKVNTARFGETMRSSIEYLDIKTGINVLRAWYMRIDYHIKNGEYLDEFEMAVADDLMRLTGDNFKDRKDIFSNLTCYNDTNFLVSNLKWISNYWDNLHDSEKSQIIEVINSERKDVRWIKAVLLNSYSPPKEIVFTILGEENLFEKEIEYIIGKFPDLLLKDCLNVFCGFPQPLWWLAVHHINLEFWTGIIKHILVNEMEVGYEICLEEFVSDGVNCFSLFKHDGLKFWEEVCEKSKNKDRLTESLISNMARSSSCIEPTSEMWTILINSYGQNDNGLKLTIKENIDLIFSNCLEDFIIVLDPKFIEDFIKPIFKSTTLTEEEALESGKKKERKIESKFEYPLDDWISTDF